MKRVAGIGRDVAVARSRSGRRAHAPARAGSARCTATEVTPAPVARMLVPIRVCVALHVASAAASAAALRGAAVLRGRSPRPPLATASPSHTVLPRAHPAATAYAAQLHAFAPVYYDPFLAAAATADSNYRLQDRGDRKCVVPGREARSGVCASSIRYSSYREVSPGILFAPHVCPYGPSWPGRRGREGGRRAPPISVCGCGSARSRAAALETFARCRTSAIRSIPQNPSVAVPVPHGFVSETDENDTLSEEGEDENFSSENTGPELCTQPELNNLAAAAAAAAAAAPLLKSPLSAQHAAAAAAANYGAAARAAAAAAAVNATPTPALTPLATYVF
ncbi:hypothetical protein EVAR_59183_1 [Eumeta japonica]|uniref:Uncharacterized protein n=1 Tax=Eumeta variegata TaxID=151549 RepID=A0A4C1ZL38_EUMVA|nr:hypothetical protein EVAR_59183_1 [Eumeta japonica]